ncbi:hypothetical protein Tsubulata_000432 [Turnera subulata]|uniref:S-protein homolog n=1 Tax=Turnera subulata TaxID=218843 RepID=A0A9Q0G1D5_9ROSI|nr:hypothetical protein Tsubulata_000432 [Turnera subulata]
MSLSNNKGVMLLAFLVVVSLWFPSTLARDVAIPNDKILSKSRVYVRNNLEDKSDVNIHCKSRDDDLGEHVIKPGERYEWKFRVSIFGNTLFGCEVKTKYGSGIFVLYNASEDEKGDDGYVGWEVRTGGVYGLNRIQHYAWQK